MSNVDPLRTTCQIITAFQIVKDAMAQAEASQIYCDQEYNDLTHALELTNFNGVQGYKLAKQLQENRQKRREAKDLKEQLEPLHDLMKRHQSFFKELKNVQAQIEQTRGTQKNRQYRVRVREDLQEVFEKSNST